MRYVLRHYYEDISIFARLISAPFRTLDIVVDHKMRLLDFLFVLLLTAVAGVQSLNSVLLPITDDFGANPTNVSMYMYKPARVANPTPLIVAIHYCSGTAQLYFLPGTLALLAELHGFILIYPSAPAADHCWDVHTEATLTHDGGGDSIAIANVVRWAIRTQGVDSTRVFSAGTSSGAMMTNVLLGAYPDLFAAGVAFSGVPYGCFAGPTEWNPQCAMGQIILTPQQWGDMVRNAYPGYSGPRPRMQTWHGTKYVLHIGTNGRKICLRLVQGYDAVPVELLGADQAVDERSRSQPDARLECDRISTRAMVLACLIRASIPGHIRSGRRACRARALGTGRRLVRAERSYTRFTPVVSPCRGRELLRLNKLEASGYLWLTVYYFRDVALSCTSETPSKDQ